MTGVVTRRRLLELAVATLFATAALRPSRELHAAQPKSIVIQIKGFQFAPRTPTLDIGDTVVWQNHDIVPHTATAMDGSWDSGLIAPGEEWKTVVSATMVRDYYCSFHPTMTANLNVKLG